MSQQIVIDSLSFAREERSLQGELQVSELERLHEDLAEAAGVIVYRLKGRMTRQNKPQLVLEVVGEIPFICQRCLGRLDSEWNWLRRGYSGFLDWLRSLDGECLWRHHFGLNGLRSK